MLRTLGFVLLWLVGSSVAVAVAWTGVAVVDNQIIRPAPASVDEASTGQGSGRTESTDSPQSPEAAYVGTPHSKSLERAGYSTTTASIVGNSDLAIASRPNADAGSTPQSGVSSTVPTTEAITAAPTTSQPITTNPPVTNPPTTSPPTTNPPTTSPPTTNPPTTAPPTTASATTAAPTTEASTTRNFNLVGGSTAVSFSPSGVRILWATPKPGFDVDIDDDRVRFKSDQHESTVELWWNGGPGFEIDEDPRD